MISAQWLETFLVLCEAGHFTRAAGRLNMTQSGAGSYDIGVADHQPTNPRLACELIGSDQLCVVLPRAQAGVSSFADLEQLGFIAHPDGLAYADELLSANFPNDYQGIDRLNIRSFINQIGQIPTPIAEGVGYTILPRSGVDSYPRREALSVMTLAYPIRHELWLVRRRGKVMAARVQRIVTEVIDAVGHVTELS